MKCTIPEIAWHNKEPILSIHIHPSNNRTYKLASAGSDSHIVIWKITISTEDPQFEVLADLSRHQKTVNCVRWSPNGIYLASCDDDATIILWQQKTDNIPLLDGESSDKEIWTVYKILRGHREDVYDLCWSPDNLKLLSGSIDNTAILWDITKGRNEQTLSQHSGFVQGVAWDPKNKYLATISTDRSCRIFSICGRYVKARVQRGLLPVPPDHPFHNKELKFFYDDTFKSFFRRLDFSPDGTLLAVPSARLDSEDCKEPFNATLIFAVESWKGPVAILPTLNQSTTVAKFCPTLFQLKEDGPNAVFSLPYRLVLAIATDHGIILYDTQQAAPFAHFQQIHYTRLTDLAWSHDGTLLIASATDGFCSIISFDKDELGVEYTPPIVPENAVLKTNLQTQNATNGELVTPPQTPKGKKPTFLEKWTVKTPKTDKTNTENIEKINVSPVTRRSDNDSKLPIRKITPKRIIPTRVVDDKSSSKKQSNWSNEIIVIDSD